MPLSTFSTGAAEVRSEGRSRMIERWNTTRDRLSQDERRMSTNEISEVDGRDLHDRPDWPLSPKAESAQETAEVWRNGDHHITSVEGDWIVAEVDDEEEAASVAHKHEGVLEYNNDDDHLYDSDRPTPRDSGRVVEGAAVAGAEISPVRSEFSRRASRRGSAVSETRSISPAREEQRMQTHMPADRDEDQDEAQDNTPPMPAGLFQGSPEQSNTLPRARTSPQPTQHGRQSSIAKTGLPGYHSRQGSYNPYNTTQIPYNRERVRYSWQSVQEDAPNRPRIHIIKLVSNTTSASSAFPGGEAFGFSISPGGRRIAAYDSSRLYIIQTAALPVGISQDFSLKRRPLAVELNDSGNLVAILADEHTVNIYDLSNSRSRRIKTFKLDFPANCIAVAPCGGLLAASYEGGIEVFSLAASALDTDRRAVRSPRMDRIVFSEDGSSLLGTTTRIHASSTVVINVPVFPAAEDNTPTPDELKLAWCSELLHPENIRNSSHAVYMREDRKTVTDRVFAWNGLADTFGILNTSDMEYGNVDFPIVIQPPLSSCGGLGAAIHSCPSIDEFGETVAMIVNDRTVRLYIVPHKAEDSESSIEAHSIDHELDEGYGCPFSELRWVYSQSNLPAPVDTHSRVKGRLVVTSPGGVYGQEIPEDSFEEPEGGRIILFDFDAQFSGQPGQTFTLNLGKSPPQPLEEEQYDVDDAVALVRRRTVKQNKANDLSQRPISLGRAATTSSTNRNSLRPGSSIVASHRASSIMSVGSSMQSETNANLPDVVEDVEMNEVFDEPFSNTAPRSQVSLQRAASNVQRHRFQTLEERDQERVSVDSNGNFLALPEYTEEPNAPLPGRFRAMAGLDMPVIPRALQNTGVPLSAPAITAESFSAEQAFATASATLAAGPSRAGMPRGLLRAYSNAANPGVQQLSPRNSNTVGGDRPGMYSNRSYDHRFSTPLTSLTEVQTNAPRRSSSTRRPGEHVYGHSPRSYEAQLHRQSTATASLFPQVQASDHVPLPVSRQAIGGIAHPVTSWRPPAPSTQSLPGTSHGTLRGHSRKSSLASKHAFATTARAKKLGFFKRSKQNKMLPFEHDETNMDDSRSMATWRTGSESKCSVM